MKSLVRHRANAGITLVELTIVGAILAIAALPLSRYVMTSLKTSTRLDVQGRSQQDIQKALIPMERDFLEMNEINVSSATYIQFILDSVRLPGFAYNRLSADQDGDANVPAASPTGPRKTGDDLVDDDDDNDLGNHIDVQCRYYLDSDGKTLVREFSFNEGPWTQRSVVATRLTTLIFKYYGSADEARRTGKSLDGNSDGSISDLEIDASADGNHNGVLDTMSERQDIASVDIIIGQDKNGDGKEDFRMETEIAPPLLLLKRRF